MLKIKPSNRNTNKHTDKGMSLLENSIDTVGVIESISVTEEGTIISGHARKELFDKKGFKPKYIKLADNEYPVIETDIKDNTKQYYQAQILANTTANKNFNLDNQLIEEIIEEYDIDIEEIGVDYYNEKGEIDYSFKNKEIDVNEFEDVKVAKELDFTDKYILIRFKDNEQYKKFIIKNNIKLEKSPNFKSENITEIERKVIFDYEDLYSI